MIVSALVLELVWMKGLAMAELRDELTSSEAAVIEEVVVRKLRRDVREFFIACAFGMERNEVGGEDRRALAILRHCEVAKTGSQAPSIELRTQCICLSTARMMMRHACRA